jgi:surface protein
MLIENIMIICVILIVMAGAVLLPKLTKKPKIINTNTEFNEVVTRYLDPETRQETVNIYGRIEDWDTSRVTIMTNAFSDEKTGASEFNADISRWETGKVTSMERMFKGAKAFDAPIGNWDVKNVENMKGMFDGASSFNQDLSEWDTSNLTNTRNMLRRAVSFTRAPPSLPIPQ